MKTDPIYQWIMSKKQEEFGLNYIEIRDFLAPELDVYARLTENQLLNRHEPEKGMFIAESPKVIERALDAGCEPVSFLVESRQIEGEADIVLKRCSDVPVYFAEADVLRQLTGFPMTRGALCCMKRPAARPVAEICGNARRVAVLEHVVNPTNVGAIFRSAAALHMDAVLLTPDCSDPFYRRAIRVSMGTVFQVPWTYLGEGKYINTLKELGFQTVAMALSDQAVPIDDPALAAEEKLAIVLGTEGDGLAARTIGQCDYTVKIPMSHGVDSLNVAAASAVAFWELGKRRNV